MSTLHEKGFCWYSDEHKLLFLGIPKNASSSIRNSLGITKSFTKLYEEKPNRFDGYKTFTVLRSPIARLVSGYIESLSRMEKETRKKSFLKIKTEPERFMACIDDMERRLSKGYELWDSHIEPQSFYLTSKQGTRIPVDYYLVFERLNEDYKKLCKRMGVKNCPLVHNNSKNRLENELQTILLSLIWGNKKLKARLELMLIHDVEIYNSVIGDAKLSQPIKKSRFILLKNLFNI